MYRHPRRQKRQPDRMHAPSLQARTTMKGNSCDVVSRSVQKNGGVPMYPHDNPTFRQPITDPTTADEAMRQAQLAAEQARLQREAREASGESHRSPVAGIIIALLIIVAAVVVLFLIL